MTHDRAAKEGEGRYRRVEHSIVTVDGEDWPPILRDNHCPTEFLDKVVNALNAATQRPQEPTPTLNQKIPLNECLVEYRNNSGKVFMRFEDGTVLRFNLAATPWRDGDND